MERKTIFGINSNVFGIETLAANVCPLALVRWMCVSGVYIL